MASYKAVPIEDIGGPPECITIGDFPLNLEPNIGVFTWGPFLGPQVNYYGSTLLNDL